MKGILFAVLALLVILTRLDSVSPENCLLCRKLVSSKKSAYLKLFNNRSLPVKYILHVSDFLLEMLAYQGC